MRPGIALLAGAAATVFAVGPAFSQTTKVVKEHPRQRALVWIAQTPPELRDTASRLTAALNRASRATTDITWQNVIPGGYVDDVLRTCPVPTLLQCFASILRSPRIRAESGLMLVLRIDDKATGPVMTGVVVVAQDIEAARTIAGMARSDPPSTELEDQIFNTASRLGSLVISRRSPDALAGYLVNAVLAPHLRAIGAWRPNGVLKVDFGACAGCTLNVDRRSTRSLVPGEKARFEGVPAGSQDIEVGLAGRTLGVCSVDIKVSEISHFDVQSCTGVAKARDKSRVLTWVGGAAVVAGASVLIASTVAAGSTPSTVCLAPSESGCPSAIAVGGQSLARPTFDRDSARGRVPLNAVGAGLLAAGAAWAIGNEWLAPQSEGWVWAAGFAAGAAGAALGTFAPR
ncbi:MAG: hypothetical protein AAF449_02575 [Myxococcota bacterium]